LAARGVTMQEYERRKSEPGWMDALKAMEVASV
jgi:hypothetical protein